LTGVLCRSLYWKFSGFLALKDAINIRCGTAKEIGRNGPIGHQPGTCTIEARAIKGDAVSFR
jgi:hypothetical protein